MVRAGVHGPDWSSVFLSWSPAGPDLFGGGDRVFGGHVLEGSALPFGDAAPESEAFLVPEGVEEAVVVDGAPAAEVSGLDVGRPVVAAFVGVPVAGVFSATEGVVHPVGSFEDGDDVVVAASPAASSVLGDWLVRVRCGVLPVACVASCEG